MKELSNFLFPVLQKLEEISQKGDNISVEYQDHLCGILQPILVKVGEDLDTDTANKIIQLLI